MPQRPEPSGFVLPRPGPALRGVLWTILGVWLACAIGVNWGGASADLPTWLCGSTERILAGEVWRLFTAPLVHFWSGAAGFGHVFSALVLLYFLSPSLEAAWGGRRFIVFVVLSSACAYSLQMLAEIVLPSTAAARLGSAHLLPGYFLGAMPAGEAIAIAWALSFRGQQVRLFFVLPVTSTGLIIFVVAASALRVVAVAETFEGLIAPFGGMLAGWAFGGKPSPARRLFLRLRVRQLEREMAADKSSRKRRVAASPLRVIEGGKDDDDDAPESGPRGQGGGYLN